MYNELGRFSLMQMQYSHLPSPLHKLKVKKNLHLQRSLSTRFLDDFPMPIKHNQSPLQLLKECIIRQLI